MWPIIIKNLKKWKAGRDVCLCLLAPFFFFLTHDRLRAPSTHMRRFSSLCVYSSAFITPKNVSSDLDMCRLAACFPLGAPSPQLMNWKLCSCHPSLSLSVSVFWSLCLLSLHTELTQSSNTWEDKCSVKLNKHNPDMLHSNLSVRENLDRDPWFHRWRRRTNKCKD